MIIWTHLVELEHPVLHTKFQGHRPFKSGEYDFKVLTIYGRGGHLVHATCTVWKTFVHSAHGGSIWSLTLIGQAVSEEKKFKECGRRRTTTTDGKRSMPTVATPMFLSKTAFSYRFRIVFESTRFVPFQTPFEGKTAFKRRFSFQPITRHW